MNGWLRSQFGRTAALIAVALAVFSVIAWQAMVWTVIVPAAHMTVSVLTKRAEQALQADRAGDTLPVDTRFEIVAPHEPARRFAGAAYLSYVSAIREGLQSSLSVPGVRVGRIAAPLEVWIPVPDRQERWLVMSWRLGGPRAPLAALGVLAAGAVIVLVGAAVSARVLTAPLAGLAVVAARLAEGERVHVATHSGPSEVRSLAVAFQSMSHRLAELDEQRELMLGGISHDLRTPLARIRVAVELLDMQDRALVEEMAASVEEMDRMIGLFLSYVRANYREQPTAASLDDIVRRALSVQRWPESPELDLRAPGMHRLAVDCVRHTLQNLVQNALEYGRGPVTVATSQRDDEVSLSVTDRGPGISPDDWVEALKPFHRLSSPPLGGHSGLGLALVDRLVRNSGGRLDCQRGQERFTVTMHLPVGQLES